MAITALLASSSAFVQHGLQVAPPRIGRTMLDVSWPAALPSSGTRRTPRRPAPAVRTRPPSCNSLLAAAAPSTPNAISLVFAFISGGLFFSTVVAGIGAVYALGLDNVRRAATLFGLVVRRVWGLTLTMLGMGRSALFGDTQTRWDDAWEALKKGFVEVRRVAAEGVEAVKLEANLYAAVVGPPGLATLQYVLDRISPLSLSTELEAALADSLAQMRNERVKSLTLKKFASGR